MKWFKFYGQDFLTDPKMRILTIEEKMCWVVIMCLANAEDKDGKISFVNEEEVMRQASVDDGSPMWLETLGFIKRFEELGMLRISNETVTGSNKALRYHITLSNFDKRQKENLTNAERQKRYRETHKNEAKNSNAAKRNDSNARLEKNRIEKNISNTNVLEAKPLYGNEDINSLKSYFLKAFNLPKEDCTVQQSGQYWNLLLKESKKGVEGVKWLIDLASKDEFYRNNITSSKDLYYKRVKIVARKRGDIPIIATMGGQNG